MIAAKERLIVALDIPEEDEARRLVERLGDTVCFYKVGPVLLLTPWGMTFVRDNLLPERQLFIDLKMGDIGATIEGAVAQAARLNDGLPGGAGVKFITLGPAARPSTYAAAKKGRGSRTQPLILAIPLLSSLDESDFEGMTGKPLTRDALLDYADYRAKEALTNGCDGLIASGELIHRFRQAHPDSMIVSPGIRPAGHGQDDHKRAATPTEAIQQGADYLVVGRPIRETDDPAGLARRIIEEIGQAIGRGGPGVHSQPRTRLSSSPASENPPLSCAPPEA